MKKYDLYDRQSIHAVWCRSRSGSEIYAPKVFGIDSSECTSGLMVYLFIQVLYTKENTLLIVLLVNQHMSLILKLSIVEAY